MLSMMMKTFCELMRRTQLKNKCGSSPGKGRTARAICDNKAFGEKQARESQKFMHISPFWLACCFSRRIHANAVLPIPLPPTIETRGRLFCAKTPRIWARKSLLAASIAPKLFRMAFGTVIGPILINSLTKVHKLSSGRGSSKYSSKLICSIVTNPLPQGSITLDKTVFSSVEKAKVSSLPFLESSHAGSRLINLSTRCKNFSKDTRSVASKDDGLAKSCFQNSLQTGRIKASQGSKARGISVDTAVILRS
eukprot:28435_5